MAIHQIGEIRHGWRRFTWIEHGGAKMSEAAGQRER
jgi:hypothetical protein